MAICKMLDQLSIRRTVASIRCHLAQDVVRLAPVALPEFCNSQD